MANEIPTTTVQIEAVAKEREIGLEAALFALGERAQAQARAVRLGIESDYQQMADELTQLGQAAYYLAAQLAIIDEMRYGHVRRQPSPVDPLARTLQRSRRDLNGGQTVWPPLPQPPPQE